MASISLRAYNKEIEGLLETEQVNDAIAHCRHILRLFPKHLETYRLLGKAYLESRRYTEAADMLQRVLSSLPDDFVSQVGMSMIREDEGNLDAAIFHMERAFEAQPSNSAVQDELKRLYGRRDGAVPAKIRLTRGALVRMYARGELYQQAIAEAKIALLENPDRVELEAILARMYFQSGQKVLATEIASRLIEKLPYCYEANRILAEVLPGTARGDDARVYKQRLIALDPYLAFIPANASSSADSPDESVMLEIFDGEIEEESEFQPDWAKSVGVKLDETVDEGIPDWLLTPEAGLAASDPLPAEGEEIISKVDTPLAEMTTTPEIQQQEPSEVEEELPDWMQAAGWQSASGDATAEPSTDDSYEEVSQEAAASQAEIPDWLQEIAPSEELTASVEGGGMAVNDEDNSWLESILSEAEQKGTALGDFELVEEEPSELAEQMSLEGEIPPTLEDDFLAEIDPSALTSVEEGEIPDWLSGLAEIEGTAEEPAVVENNADWLDVLSSKEPALSVENLEPAEGVQEFLSSIDELPAEATGVEQLMGELATGAEKNTDDFLMEFEAAAPADPDATQPTRVRQPVVEIPAVIPFEVEEEAETPLPEEAAAFAEGMEFTDEVEPVEAAPEISEIIAESPVKPVPMLMDEEDLSIFDLVEPEEQQVQAELAEKSIDESGPEDIYIPEWLKESLDKEPVEPEFEAIAKAVEEPLAAVEETEAEVDDDAAFAWLEALAARQGADEETLQVAPEERIEETPDWIKSEIEQAEMMGETPETKKADEWSGSDVEQVESETGEITTGDSLEIIGPSDIEEELTEFEPTGQELPEGLVDETSVLEGVGATSYETPATEVETPEWLPEVEEELREAEEPAIAQAESPSAEDELPDWLKETLGTEDEVVEEQSQPEESATIYRTAGEWQPEELIETEPQTTDMTEPKLAGELEPEQVKEEQSAPVEQIEVVPEVSLAEDTEPEEVPEWLQDLAGTPTGESQKAAIDAEAPPDWLKDLEGEDSGLIPDVPYSASAGQTGWINKAEPAPPAIPVEDTSPVRVAPSPVPSPVAPASGEDLYNAQAALNSQDIDKALDYYNRLIQRGEALEDTIHDLRDAIYRHPVDVNIWQSLGDAYLRSNQLQEALDAYTKAEEFLR